MINSRNNNRKNRILSQRIMRKCMALITQYISHYFIRMPLLYAFIMYMTSSRTMSLKGSKKNKTLKVLAIAAPGGDADIKAIANTKMGSNIEFLYVNSLYFSKPFDQIVGDKEISEYNMKLPPEHILRKKYSDYATKILNITRKYFFNYSLVINFNFIHRYTRDLENIAKENNFKLATLMKECLRTEAFWKATLSTYKNKLEEYKGDLVLVHNKKTSDILKESGKFSCPIVITGQPRSDLLKTISEKNKKYCKKSTFKILYFMIKEKAGLPYFGSEYYEDRTNTFNVKSWGESPNFNPLECIFEFLKEHRNVELCIKGKPDEKYDFPKIPKSIKSRVEIMHGNPSMNIYSDASLVIGFNSTCLIESHISYIPTASIDFYDHDVKSIEDYLLVLPESINRLRTSKELKLFIEKIYANGNTGITVDQSFTECYIGNKDFNSGKRSAEALIMLSKNKYDKITGSS